VSYRSLTLPAASVDEFDAFEEGWYQLVLVPAFGTVVVQVESELGKWSVRAAEVAPTNELDFGALSSGSWSGASGVWTFGPTGTARVGMMLWCPAGARVGTSVVLSEVRYCGPERPQFWWQLA
jgi:hypothetical protein